MDYEKRKRFIVNLLYGGQIALLVYITVKYGFGLLAPFLLAFLFGIDYNSAFPVFRSLLNLGMIECQLSE